ncbi:unnamed protein product, partial [Rotaria sp. Silwood2]
MSIYTNIVTSNITVIGTNSISFTVYQSTFIFIFRECLIVIDKTDTPQDLSTVFINGESIGTSGQTIFNEVLIDDNRF